MTGYNFSMTDQDSEAFDQQATALQQETEQWKRQAPAQRPRVAFIRRGAHVIRIYPTRDPNGVGRILRKIHTHMPLPIDGPNSFGRYRRVNRVWADDRINKIVRYLENQRMTYLAGESLWKYYSRFTYLMCAHIYETADPNPKWHPPGATVILQLPDRHALALSSEISSWTREDKRDILEPSNPAPGIRINTTGEGKATNVSVSLAGQRKLALAMPPRLIDDKDPNVFHDFSGLDNIYVTEEDRISDEDYQAFRRFANEELKRFKASRAPRDTTEQAFRFERPAVTVADYQDLPPPRALPPVSPAPPRSPNSQEEKCFILQKGKNQGDLAAARFGNKPATFNPYCSVCDSEDPCTEVTEQNPPF